MATSLKSSVLLQIYLMLIVQLETSQSIGSGNSKGRAFMVTFLKTFGKDSHNGVIITTDLKTVIFVSVPSTGTLTSHLLQANSSFHLRLPHETSATTWGIPERKAVSVFSTAPVSVYGITSQKKSAGAYLALPIDKWADHYIVATFDGYLQRGGEIAIISAEDDTSISVILKVVRRTRCIVEKRTVENATLLAFSMNKEDVLRIACDDDLTGSVIKGSKPIGVIAGNSCTRVPPSKTVDSEPKNDRSCDHLVEMMIPSKSLGNDYIVAAAEGRETTFRVVYGDNEGSTNTSVQTVGSDITVTRANHLYKEFTVSPKTIVRLNASRPVLVVVYSSGPSADGSMTVVAPQDIYDSQYNVGLDWLSLIEGIAMKVTLSQYTPVDVSTALGAKFQKNITAAGFGFLVTQADVTNLSFLSVDSFAPGSNIIVSASGSDWSAEFPVGLKLEFFTGADNCSESPCQGICYTHGHSLLCYCADQLTGENCENDIFNACDSSPCQNNGTCVDLPFLFECVCLNSFTGYFCESGVLETTRETTSASTEITSTEVARETVTYISGEASWTTETSTSGIYSQTTEMYERTAKSMGLIKESQMCTCMCENMTSEMIEIRIEEIKKELSVDAKETHKNKNKYITRYDARPSATSIGIVGTLFLGLVFGIIFILDLITAIAQNRRHSRRHNWSHAQEKGKEHPCHRILSSPFHYLPHLKEWFNGRRNTDTKSQYVDSQSETTVSWDHKPSTLWGQKSPVFWGYETQTNIFNPWKAKSELIALSWPSVSSVRNRAYMNAFSESSINTIEILNLGFGPKSHDIKSEKDNICNHDMTEDTNQLPQTPRSKPSTFDLSVISMPRFQISSDKILVVGKKGKALNTRRASWTHKREPVTRPDDSLATAIKENPEAKNVQPHSRSRYGSFSEFI